MMHKIKNVEHGGIAETGAKFKIIKSTAGEFLSRTSAYNQTIERIESVLTSQKGKRLIGPPLKILTFKYDRQYKPRQKFLFIKQLTESRLTGKEFYGVNIFKNEIEFIKNRLSNENKVVLMYPQISGEDWKVFSYEDALSISQVQALSRTPHPTIPISPKWNSDKGIEIIKDTKANMTETQSYNVCIHPHMNLREQKILINSIKDDSQFLGVMAVGRTPAETQNTLAYRQIFEILPNTKLFIVSDLEDKFGGQNLPTQLALRFMGADITCKSVKPSLPGYIFSKQLKKRYDKLALYVDEVAGILDEVQQRKWTGRSITEILANSFTLREGINWNQLATTFNFSALNRTGLLEVKKIQEMKHKQYLEKRIYLKAFGLALMNKI